MIHRVRNQQFCVEAEFDGDFWIVGVYEVEGADKRLRFEYKLNAPKDEREACRRAWELFEARYIK
tara:strand:+ start:258 stop:452 length:195 start_codon:yes stop_codon:yes gene_type:complete